MSAEAQQTINYRRDHTVTDTTAARRHLLGILLDRVERGALLDSERLLLRPLVTAELEDARDALSAAGQNGAHGDDWPAVAPAIRSLAADLGLIRHRAADLLAEARAERQDAEQQLADRYGQLTRVLRLGPSPSWDDIVTAARIAHHDARWLPEAEQRNADNWARAEAAEATLVRVRAQCADWAQLASPGDVGMTPDDTAFAEAGRIILAVLDGPSPTPDNTPPHIDSHDCIDGTTRPYCRESCTGCAGADAIPCSRKGTRERTTR